MTFYWFVLPIEIVQIRLTMMILSLLLVILFVVFFDFLRLWRKHQKLLDLKHRIAVDTIKHKLLFGKEEDTTK